MKLKNDLKEMPLTAVKVLGQLMEWNSINCSSGSVCTFGVLVELIHYIKMPKSSWNPENIHTFALKRNREKRLINGFMYFLI